MAILDIFKRKQVKDDRTKNPTASQDSIAYNSGGRKTFTEDYNDYISSVETLDKVTRIIANVASMAKIEVMKDVSGELKPLKVKNVDLDFSINENDSQADFLRKTFSSIFSHGAAIILAQKSRETGFIGFYPYNPASFAIEATESSLVSEFIYTSESGTEMKFAPKDVIYINNTIDITNLVYPISRLAPLNDMLTLQANIMKQTTDFYASGSKDSVMVSPKEPMSAENAFQLKGIFDDFIQSRQTRTLFLNTEVDVERVSNAQSPREIMEAMTAINKIIVESYGIPEYLYGSYAGYVNDAAVKTACRLFFEVQLKPVFKAFDHQMTKYFRNTLKLKNAIIKTSFNDVEILHDSLDTKIEQSSKLYKLGLMSMNEAREFCELEPLDTEDANMHFLPAYLTGSAPVSIENYQEMIANGLMGTDDGELPAGASGGEDNEATLTNEEKGTEPETANQDEEN